MNLIETPNRHLRTPEGHDVGKRFPQTVRRSSDPPGGFEPRTPTFAGLAGDWGQRRAAAKSLRTLNGTIPFGWRRAQTDIDGGSRPIASRVFWP